MKNDNQIIAFRSKKIRRHWDEKKLDKPTDYLKKLRKRDFELGIYIGTNCPQVEMTT